MVAKAPGVLDSEYCERIPSLSFKHVETAVTGEMRFGEGDSREVAGGQHVVPRRAKMPWAEVDAFGLFIFAYLYT